MTGVLRRWDASTVVRRSRLSDLWTLWTDFSVNEKLLRTREPSFAERLVRMKLLQDACSAMSARAITVLSLKNPEADWHRWLDELKAVVKTYGQDFYDAPRRHQLQ